ncbi:MAG: DUF2207 domain-containing protein, partial [Candidatus Nomurabacteria bacterium]|nr:DUF2207 domain-containing protein [Candidatus Nomurabacteria bacterium]
MLYRCKTTKKLLKLAVIASIFVGFVAPQSAFASVQDFYFSEMHTDYYLSRESDGISKMRVKETLTVQFPKTNQNKGIERAIPLTNQGGVNIVFNDTNVTVTRNGTLEPIWSTERTKNYYLVATGTDDYILGDQVFGFEYVMDRVVTDFGDYQELFWDVNGTDWKQRFDSVSTTVHFDAASAEAFTGKTTCYTGVYGSKERACTVVVTDDGKSVTITATRALQPSENLSFVLGFNAGVFVVPEGQESYLGFTASMISTSLAIVISALSIVEYRRRVHRPKKQHERTIVPEYLPPKEVSVFDAQGVLFGIKKGGNVMTAQIIDLAVRHKIKIIEEESKGLLGKVKKTYFLELLSREGLRSEESELL